MVFPLNEMLIDYALSSKWHRKNAFGVVCKYDTLPGVERGRHLLVLFFHSMVWNISLYFQVAFIWVIKVLSKLTMSLSSMCIVIQIESSSTNTNA